jgi:UPF0755 protein
MAKKKSLLKIFWGIVFALLIVVGIMGYLIYEKIYTPNFLLGKKSSEYLFIPTGSTFEDVVSIMDKNEFLNDEKSFRWTAHQMKYEKNVKPGKYLLKKNMSNKDVISLLRSGRQTPVNVIFNNIRTKEQLAEKIGEQIEAPAQSILNLLNDADYTKKLGFTPDNILAMFIPNTYELYWNTSADKFIRKMKKENDLFWTPTRLAKSKKIELTPIQISVIASIVQLESNKEDEKPVIAGVYINRFKKDWKLEADPTLVYALGDFTVNRVLNAYKEIDSPYNTYMYKGIPPGPICLPTISSLNAVLNYTNHTYMYFCAKEDFSGYHSFASTYEKHLENARRFQKALDRKGIRS